MQVRPRGQKKPGQHGLHISALDGTESSNEVPLGSSAEQAQPDWQPGAQELWLQFLLILPTRLLPKLLRYNSISALPHSIVTICPLLWSMQSEMKLGSELKLNVSLKSLSTLDMQKPYLLCTSPVRSLVTASILARSSSRDTGDGGGGGSGGSATSGTPPCWHRPPAGSSERRRRRNSTPAGSGLDGMDGADSSRVR